MNYLGNNEDLIRRLAKNVGFTRVKIWTQKTSFMGDPEETALLLSKIIKKLVQFE